MILPGRIVLLFILIASAASILYGSPLDVETASALMESTEKVGRKIVSSVIKSRSVTSPGQWIFYGSGGISILDQIWTEPDISGDRLTGASYGGGVSYGLNNRWDLNATLTGCDVNGRAVADFYPDLSGTTGADLSFSMAQLFLGGSYEIYEGKRLSLPLSMGLMGSWYSLEAELDRTNLSGSWDGLAQTSLTGFGVVPGIMGGIGAECGFGWIVFKANSAFMTTFGGVSGESETNFTDGSTGNTSTHSQDFQTDPYFGITYGLGMELFPRKHWKVSLDFSDFLPLPSNARSPVKVYTLGMTVSYTP